MSGHCGLDEKQGGCCEGCGHDGEHGKNRGSESHTKEVVILLISLAALVASFFDFGTLPSPAWIVVLLCGTPIMASALKNLSKRRVTADLLIAAAMLASIVLEFTAAQKGEDYIVAAGEIAFLMALGEYIEELVVNRARAGIGRLANLTPQRAEVRRGNRVEEVSVSDLQIGDIAIVRPNSLISADGVVVVGNSAVDESSMTGESLPVDVTPGSKVFAGTKNGMGALEIEVKSLAGETQAAKLVAIVEEAEGKRAPISRLADRWASYIVPLAAVLSVLVFVFSLLVLKVGTVEAVIRGVTILVVFCPCALALSTPTAVAAGLGRASMNGILIKSGAFLETMAGVDTIALDKTGTLTKGDLRISNVKSFGLTEKELLRYAAAAERWSEHPIARAITAGITNISDSSDIEARQGVGISATVNGKRVSVGKWEPAEAGGEALRFAKTHISEGKTVVSVSINGSPAGLIAISDTLREDAAETIKRLGELSVSAVMLTGDNPASAAFIARAAGIPSYKAALLPQDKVSEIERLKAAGKKVCMAGDGVNDAPALALADCSVAVGALANDITAEAADAILLGGGLMGLASLKKLSKRTMHTVKTNMILSLSLNFVAVLLSIPGILNPVTGALLHNAATVLVVINSAFILSMKR